MSVILSYRMGKRFPSGTVFHIYANFWFFVIHILPLWPMSATSLWDMCLCKIIWSLELLETVFSTGNDALLDDICNHLFDSDSDFYFYGDEITSNDPLVYHQPWLDEVWLS